MPTLDHNYGTSSQGAPALLAVPMESASVNVTVLDWHGRIVGTTATDSQGRWLRPISVSDGKYFVKFTGYFRPAGTGPHRTANPVISQTVEVDTSVLATSDAGAQGSQGAVGVQGSQGLFGNPGIQGFQGLQMSGFQGPQGALGISGAQGIQGTTGSRGLQGLGSQGVQGSQGAFPASYHVAASGDTTTSSSTATVMSGMQISNVPAGTYLLFFGTYLKHSASGAQVTTDIYVGGSSVSAQQVWSRGDTSHQSTHCYSGFKITVTSQSTVAVYWSTSASTATANNRYLTLLKI